jgi:hypothetical protein
MRGFIMGFGKRLASIALTEFHELNPAVGAKCTGSHMRGICEAFGDTRIVADVTIEERVEAIPFSGMPFIVNRHFPGVDASSPPVVNNLATLEVDSYQRGDIWTGSGKILMQSNHPAVQALQPVEYLNTRSFREGFTLKGIRLLKHDEI